MKERQVTIKDNLLLTIRKALEKDAKGMVKMLKQTTYESNNITRGPGEFTYTVEEEKEFIRRAHNTQNNAFFVGIIDNEVIAVANISSSNRPRMKHLGELGISVLKKHWNKGVGTAMMEYIIDWAREVGLRKIDLGVRSDHKSGIHLYKKVGFVREGQRSRHMRIDGEFIDIDMMGLEIDP